MTGGMGSGTLWLAMGWTMLHEIWVGALIGLLALLVARGARPCASGVRYGLALGCLFVLAFSPLAILAVILDHAPAAVIQIAPASRSMDALGANGAQPHAELGPALRALPVPAVGSSDHPVEAVPLAGYVAWLPGVWVVGSTLTLGLLALGLVGAERLRWRSPLVLDGSAAQVLDRLARSLGLAGRVALGVCDRISSPILVGVLRPLILLPPAALTGWTPAQLEMAILHELLHVKRLDNLVNLLQRLVEAMLFFQPAAWGISRWVRLERELACDCEVVRALGKPIEYAEMLMRLASPRFPAWASSSAFADRQTAARIRVLLQGEDRSMRGSLSEGMSLFGGILAVCGLAFWSWADEPGKPSSPTARGETSAATAGVDPHGREGNPALVQALTAAATDLKALPDDPHDRATRPMALVDLAAAQVAAGDGPGALATLRWVLDNLKGNALEIAAVQIRAAEGQRKAGDPAAARATLDQLEKKLGLLDRKLILETLKKQQQEVQPEARVSDAELELGVGLVRGEFLALMTDQWLALGEREHLLRESREIIRLADQEKPRDTVLLLALAGSMLRQAGEPSWRETLTKARKAADSLTARKDRVEVVPRVAQFLVKTGAVDEAMALLESCQIAGMAPAYRMMLEALCDDNPRQPWFDYATIKITIGADSFTPRDAAVTRAALPAIARAVRLHLEIKEQARLLAMVAHLQAKLGDFADALATARSIPALERGKFRGWADGFYDAIKPVALAYVAKVQAKSKDAGPGAAGIYHEAIDAARLIKTPEQKAVALVAIAEALRDSGLAAESLTVVDEAKTAALACKEPARSLALVMIVNLELPARGVEAAIQTARAIRESPGLEKARALATLAATLEKQGQPAEAQKLYREALQCVERPLPPDPGSAGSTGRTVLSWTAHSFVDFERDTLPKLFVEGFRKSTAESLRLALEGGDRTAAVQKLPVAERDGQLLGIIHQLASEGEPARALALAASLKNPQQRLNAIHVTATAIRDRDTTRR